VEKMEKGVELEVYVKKVLALNYFGTPLQLVGIYEKI
jgi:hypothetical protein